MTDEATSTIPSLRDRLKARREELHQERPIDIPVPGYEDLIVARYHPLDYHVIRRIGENNKAEKNQVQQELNIASDMLTHACTELLEVQPDGTGASTGFRWSTTAARELFEVDPSEVPDGATVREALLAIFPDDTSIVQHFARYTELSSTYHVESNEVLQGESAAT